FGAGKLGRLLRALHLPVKPCPSETPIPLHGARGYLQKTGDFFLLEAAEDAQFHDPALLGIQLAQTGKRFVEIEQFLGANIKCDLDVVDVDLIARPAAFLGVPGARVIHQDTAHHLRSYGVKVAPALPFLVRLLDQAQIRFANQLGRLQRMIVALPPHVAPRHAAKLPIYQRYKLPFGLSIPALQFEKELCHVSSNIHCEPAMASYYTRIPKPLARSVNLAQSYSGDGAGERRRLRNRAGRRMKNSIVMPSLREQRVEIVTDAELRAPRGFWNQLRPVGVADGQGKADAGASSPEDEADLADMQVPFLREYLAGR